MALDDLEWHLANEPPARYTPYLSKYAFIPGYKIWEYSDDTYDFDPVPSTYSEWSRVDRFTAECVLVHLTTTTPSHQGAPHASHRQPAPPAFGGAGD